MLNYSVAELRYRTNFLAQMTISAFGLINLRIPKAFIVRMERYSLGMANITTCLTATTIYFIFYLYHFNKPR